MAQFYFPDPGSPSERANLAQLLDLLQKKIFDIQPSWAIMCTAPEDYSYLLENLGAVRINQEMQTEAQEATVQVFKTGGTGVGPEVEIPSVNTSNAKDKPVRKRSPGPDKTMICSQCGELRQPTKSGVCKPCAMANAKTAKKTNGKQPNNFTPGNADSRFSEPTVFTEDREANQRILTRHGAIKGKRLG